MDWIGQFFWVLLIKLVSPAVLNPGEKNNEIRGYEVTENIIDIPDNRTLPPIISNFTLVLPLNYGNNTVAVINNANNNKESSEENNNAQSNNKDSEENNNEESSEENIAQNNNGLKKNSFSILHIKAEYDKPETQNHQNVLSKVFGSVKEYVYHLKKGVVDGLHSFFHKNDDGKKKPEFHDKFHRNFEDGYDFGEDNYFNDDDDDDDEPLEHFGHYE